MESRKPGWKQELQKTIKALGTGFILFYFSELVFWPRIRPDDSLQGLLFTWLIYSFAAWVMMAVMEYFRVSSFPALFLAGAFFGWLIEGVIVQTVYEDLPLSISFTGLAWHALISVCGGWLLVRRMLRRKPVWMTLLSLAYGLAYGLWAISWWVEEPGKLFPVGDFALYAFGSTLALIGSCRILERVDHVPLEMRRWQARAVGALLLVLFGFGSAAAEPVSIVIFPLLMLAVFLPLRLNRAAAGRLRPVDLFTGQVRAVNYWLIILMPMSAILVYWLAWVIHLRIPTHWILYLITTPAGFYLFIRSAWKIFREEQFEIPDDEGNKAGGDTLR
jgi:hypothetical protein